MPDRGEGEVCAYCQRTLESVYSISQLQATRDHVMPKSKGSGRGTVWACRRCNHLKGDMIPEEWAAYMRAVPNWWRQAVRPKYWMAEATRRSPTLPIHESKMILRHGRLFWDEWRYGNGIACECCFPPTWGDVTYTAEGWPIVPRAIAKPD